MDIIDMSGLPFSQMKKSDSNFSKGLDLVNLVE